MRFYSYALGITSQQKITVQLAVSSIANLDDKNLTCSFK